MPTLLHEAQEVLPVRMRRTLRPACRRHFERSARQREEAFRAEEPAVCDLRQPGRAQRVREPIANLPGRCGHDRAAGAAGVVIAGERRDAFEDRRLADVVLADEDRYNAIEFEIEALLQDRQAEWKRGAILDSGFIEHNAPEIGCRQSGSAWP